MPLSNADHSLSMRISPRSKKNSADEQTLRSVLLHRLSDTYKVVVRRSLKTERLRGRFCERCQKWYEGPLWTGIPERIDCDGCKGVFRIEAVFYEEIVPAEDFLAGEEDGMEVRAEGYEDVDPDGGAGG